jgi:glutathione S-transferase
MGVRLLAAPGSHACASAEAMLVAKGVSYERVDLIPALSRLWLRATGFAGVTVPALRLDGVRVHGSRAIARALEARWPDPPLFPADPSRRPRVEEIERWGDGPLQEVARRIILWALGRSAEGRRAALDGARLQFHVPNQVALLAGWPIVRLDAALNGADETAVLADLRALPQLLDRVDQWIADGDLGTEPPTAADFQVAGSVRMLLTVEDLQEVLAGRPTAEHALRLIPVFPGHLPAGVLRAAWRS